MVVASYSEGKFAGYAISSSQSICLVISQFYVSPFINDESDDYKNEDENLYWPPPFDSEEDEVNYGGKGKTVAKSPLLWKRPSSLPPMPSQNTMQVITLTTTMRFIPTPTMPSNDP
ncbi:hypothetical protein VNO77_04282 [Canavalia gladiata]|uniref:Uncharacterized protein n=1 Tax=Canavalia gladiata TaxID=3824 RepID=A0AAN9RD13_CANGL